MTFRTLTLRSLRFHWRAHLGVVLGAAVGSAALIGALVVGDSVRGSLHQLAVQRLGNIHYAMAPSDRFFRERLAGVLESTVRANDPSYEAISAVTALRLPATASRQNGAARANHVQLLGVPPGIWKMGAAASLTNLASDAVALNEALAGQLDAKIGDTVLLRVQKPTALSQDAIIAPRNESSVALRLKVQAIVPAAELGNFSLAANQIPPLNAFMRLDVLAQATGLGGQANLVLVGPILKARPGQASLTVSKVKAHISEWSAKLFRFFHRPTPLEPESPTGAVAALDSALRTYARLPDFELELRRLTNNATLELRSSRIFLDAPAVRAAHSSTRENLRGYEERPGPPAYTNYVDVLTYLVNQFRVGERTTPYSMVTATGAPVVPAEMANDEILINQWLADDLQVGPGADIAMSYFLADSGARLVERTNHFRVRGIVPMTAPYADRAFMPDFPGIAKAESTHDWDAGFPLVHKIRDQDDQYWKEWRGTPKAFITLAAGQRMWGNRFGSLTAIRFPMPRNKILGQFHREVESDLMSNLKPDEFGLRFEPVQTQALAAAAQAQDFGQLFLGFSFFLIVAALILMALLFQFGLEQRTAEVGTLLALGFTPKQVRRLLLSEGTALAFVGGVIGVLAGMAYAQVMLVGLTTIWRGAVGTSALGFHVTASSLALGLAASVIVSAVTIWLVLRKQARRPARELLAEGSMDETGGREEGESEIKIKSKIMSGGGLPLHEPEREGTASPLTPALSPLRGEGVEARRARVPRSLWVGVVAATGALGLVGWALARNETADAETFFSAGSLFLVAGLGFSAALFALVSRRATKGRLTVAALGVRGCTRRRKRSLATVSLLATGSFLVVAIGAFKLDANADAFKRSSGTGGFALSGESTLPIVQDLNSQAGREFFGLSPNQLASVDILPLRVRNGDEASCLNLNRAQVPRLLGVVPQRLQSRGAFTFAKLAAGLPSENPWLLLERKQDDGAVPAIGDLNSIVWAMAKKVGDTLSMVDDHGQPFKLRLVGGLANSILQGSLLISEDEFIRRFPGESGYRMFLIDAPSNHVAAVSATLSRALQDVGFESTLASGRLAAFNAVQNTYLKTFQVLGRLGLLLGSAGLGVVVLRNVLERRGELALLQAVGFRRRTLQWLVLSEHGALLWLGLVIGILAALVAILPVLLAPGAEVQYRALGGTLAGVLISGLIWTWLATKLALRGELLRALRNE